MGIVCEVGRTTIAATLEKEGLAWWNNKDRERESLRMGENLEGLKG